MKPEVVANMTNVVDKLKVCKPYAAPELGRLSPAIVKSLLSQDAGMSASELQQLIESDDQLHGVKGL